MVKTMSTESTCSRSPPLLDRKTCRPLKDQALNCPRCSSNNTKFCYYNNYSLSQPRYFCKTCRRYWTEGGSLRNVPVGGGSRKTKRSSSSSPSTPLSSSTKLNSTTTTTHQNPNKIHGSQELNLAYPPPDHHDYSTFVDDHHLHQNPTNSSPMELFKTEIITSRNLSSFMAIPTTTTTTSSSPHHDSVYSSGLTLQELNKPTLSFSLDGLESCLQLQGGGVQESGARLLFPMDQGTKQADPIQIQFENNHNNRGDDDGSTGGFWGSGMLGGGGGGGSW